MLKVMQSNANSIINTKIWYETMPYKFFYFCKYTEVVPQLHRHFDNEISGHHKVENNLR